MSKPRLLFVYGTLRPCATTAMGLLYRRRLAREAQVRGAATIRGRLYDLGAYPGLADSAGLYDASRVAGDVIELADPEATFRWLDPYEDIVPGRRDNPYERCVRPAVLDLGCEIDCWVYIYRGSLAGARQIRCGRWRR